METFISKLNIYLIPPVTSLVVGLFLAILFLVKGKFKKENVYFSLVCIWFSLLAPLFISHHFLRGNIEAILKFERSIHLIYVYLPIFYVLFFQALWDIKRPILLWSCIILSTVFSISTQTDYYINGLYTYSWGYIAKGGIAFQLFGLYAMIITVYFGILYYRMLRVETNYIRRLRVQYLSYGFGFVAFLNLLNIPAMNGIDFYPLGNFMFIPLLIFAYGVFKYRLMEIQSLLYLTLIWAVFSSLFLIPNIVVYLLLRPYFGDFPTLMQVGLLILWFIINYFYLIKLQPKIDQFFNKRKYNLRAIAAQFIENIAFLKTLDALIAEFTGLLKKALNLNWADVYIKDRESRDFINHDGLRINYNKNIEEWFRGATHLTERLMVEKNPYYAAIEETLLNLFDSLKCSYIMPIMHNHELIAMLVMSKKINEKVLTDFEMKFINNIISTLTISLANSMMYQELNTIKENLEYMVEDRTAELQATMEEMESINETLIRTNKELEFAQQTQKKDMEMAKNVQASLFQVEPPKIPEYDIALTFKPMAGVSGDLYDFYEKDGALVGIALFDVSGHGIASALITMIARTIFRRHFFNMQDERLSLVIERANHDFIKETENVDNYLTGIILRFNGEEVEYVNAAHPDILYKHPVTNKVVIINKKGHDFKGLFLGSEEMYKPFETLKFKIRSGDTLLLYTDCLIEGKNTKKIEYGETRLRESFFRASTTASAGEILGSIISDFNNFVDGAPPFDDLTAIVLKRN